MAKFKSSAKSDAPAAARKPAADKATEKPAQSSRRKAPAAVLGAGAQTIMGSAQQIWQTGVTALGRAQQESTRLFEALVKEGAGLEQKTRSLAANKVDSVRKSVRGSVENRVDQVKDRASDTWERLEKLFEERVQRAMTRLGVPGREELQALIDRVDLLNVRLRELATPSAATADTKKAEKPVAPAATKPAPRKVAVKKSVSTHTATSKTVAKPARAKKPAAAKAVSSKAAAAADTAVSSVTE